MRWKMDEEIRRQEAQERMAKARAAKVAKQEAERKEAEEISASVTIPEPAQAPSIVSFQSMTSDEKAIASKVMAENRDWATIDPQATLDYSLAEDPFKLPEPAQKLQEKKEFAFRWYKRSPERVDEVMNFPVPRRWWPVNRMQPVGGLFDKHVDGSTGAVHLMDQMLFFKPWWMYEKQEYMKARLADTRGDLTSRDGQEKNDLRLAAARRKPGDPRTRTEISGSDIQFRGEADVDGGEYGAVSESDLVVNE